MANIRTGLIPGAAGAPAPVFLGVDFASTLIVGARQFVSVRVYEICEICQKEPLENLIINGSYSNTFWQNSQLKLFRAESVLKIDDTYQFRFGEGSADINGGVLIVPGMDYAIRGVNGEWLTAARI